MDQLEEMRQISRELWRKSQEHPAHKDDSDELKQACRPFSFPSQELGPTLPWPTKDLTIRKTEL